MSWWKPVKRKKHHWHDVAYRVEGECREGALTKTEPVCGWCGRHMYRFPLGAVPKCLTLEEAEVISQADAEAEEVKYQAWVDRNK